MLERDAGLSDPIGYTKKSERALAAAIFLSLSESDEWTNYWHIQINIHTYIVCVCIDAFL